MPNCPHCQRSEQQVKVGFNPSGSQRYLCKDCRRKYTPERKPRGYAEAIRQAAVQMYVDGTNLRRIARTLGVSHPTVAQWVKALAAQLPAAPPDAAMPLDVNELDE